MTATRWLFVGLVTGLVSQGVIAFVTNGSFIDGNADAGLRACLADEFSHLYVFNLRGNTSVPSGERARKEGGQIFGLQF